VRISKDRDANYDAGQAAAWIPEIDMWRAANLLVKRHGPDAAIVAARGADERLAAGDGEGQRISKHIVDAILKLQREKPDEGERTN
jgi:hypothetical protein